MNQSLRCVGSIWRLLCVLVFSFYFASLSGHCHTFTNGTRFCLDEAQNNPFQKASDPIQPVSLLPQLLCPDGACSALKLKEYGVNIPTNSPAHYHLFIHIPKTGGSSMREFFRDVCKYHNITLGITLNAFWKGNRPFLRTGRFASSRGIFGHYAYGLHRLIATPAVYTYYAIYRNPIERWLSHYVWAKKIYDFVHKHSLSQWVNVKYDCNLQFAILSGLAPNDFSLQNRIHTYWPVPCDNYDQSHFQLVDRVKKMIDSEFQMIVLQGKFEQSLVLLCDYFHIPENTCFKFMKKHTKKYHVTNSSKRLKELSPKQMEKVRQQNLLDILIYDHIVAVFEKKWQEYKNRNPESRFRDLE